MYQIWVFTEFKESVQSLQTSLHIQSIHMVGASIHVDLQYMSLITGSVSLVQPDVSVLIKDTMGAPHTSAILGFKPSSSFLTIKPHHSTICRITAT